MHCKLVKKNPKKRRKKSFKSLMLKSSSKIAKNDQISSSCQSAENLKKLDYIFKSNCDSIIKDSTMLYSNTEQLTVLGTNSKNDEIFLSNDLYKSIDKQSNKLLSRLTCPSTKSKVSLSTCCNDEHLNKNSVTSQQKTEEYVNLDKNHANEIFLTNDMYTTINNQKKNKMPLSAECSIDLYPSVNEPKQIVLENFVKNYKTPDGKTEQFYNVENNSKSDEIFLLNDFYIPINKQTKIKVLPTDNNFETDELFLRNDLYMSFNTKKTSKVLSTSKNINCNISETIYATLNKNDQVYSQADCSNSFNTTSLTNANNQQDGLNSQNSPNLNTSLLINNTDERVFNRFNPNETEMIEHTNYARCTFHYEECNEEYSEPIIFLQKSDSHDQNCKECCQNKSKKTIPQIISQKFKMIRRMSIKKKSSDFIDKVIRKKKNENHKSHSLYVEEDEYCEPEIVRNTKRIVNSIPMGINNEELQEKLLKMKTHQVGKMFKILLV